jgi:ribose-phosphate pyrophosphokinase
LLPINIGLREYAGTCSPGKCFIVEPSYGLTEQEARLKSENIRLFSLNASRDFADKLSRELAVALSPHEEREFEDGEHKARPLTSVRGKDVYVIQSLHAEANNSVNDKLCRLLFFIGALRDASAERITVVAPYLAYARKDQKSKSRDPVTTRYVAQMFECVGTDRLVTLDVHNLAAFQNAFRCRTEHLVATKLMVEFFSNKLADKRVAVVSPDIGGVKRAELFRQSLSHAMGADAGSAFMEKQRSGGVVSGDTLVGDVRGRVTVILDDLISSGTTIARAVEACAAAGAESIHAAATHGVFTGNASENLSLASLDSVVITDTIPVSGLDAKATDKIVVLSSAPLFAEAVGRLHCDGSIVDLLTL